jgi:hypothetical protein
LTGLVVNLGTALADFNGLAAMALVGRHEFDAAVAVPVILPVDERDDPLTGLLFGCKWLAGVISPISTAPRDCV